VPKSHLIDERYYDCEKSAVVNSKNPHQLRQNTIKRFVKDNISTYIDVDCADEVKELA